MPARTGGMMISRGSGRAPIFLDRTADMFYICSDLETSRRTRQPLGNSAHLYGLVTFSGDGCAALRYPMAKLLG